MGTRQNRNRCQGRTKEGRPCGAAATESGLCYFHTNPNKAVELGRIGGRRNRRAAAENADPFPVLDNALAVRNTVARLIGDVRSGIVQPRIAAILIPLLSLQLRAIETTDQEQRIMELESRKNAEAQPREDLSGTEEESTP
jgi:hypothetical protein